MLFYGHWASGQPDNAGGIEDCAMIDRSLDFYWDDVDCDGVRAIALCQVLPTTE